MGSGRRPRRLAGAWLRGMLLGALVAGAVTVAGLGLMQGRTTAAGAAEAGSPARMVAAEPSRHPSVAVVGDSNTAVDSSDFADGDIGGNSWVSVLQRGGLRFAGGWAVAGSTSGTQASALEPVTADVLLIMTGTNDLTAGIPVETVVTHIDRMAETVSSARVVLLAIPPRNGETSPSSAEFNARLAALAAERGWEYFDPMGFLRDPAGGFVAGTTLDGLHLSASAEHAVGRAVAAYLGWSQPVGPAAHGR